METALDKLETKIIHFTDNLQRIERQELYKSIIQEKLKQSPSKSGKKAQEKKEKEKIEYCWLNNFLKKYKLKKKNFLNSQLIESFGDLKKFSEESVSQLTSIIDQKNKKYLIELTKTLIKISTRQNLILHNLEDFLEYGLPDIQSQFELQLEESMNESAGIITELELKILNLESRLKKIDPGIIPEKVVQKKDKKIFKLKNKIESLMKKNSTLKLKINGKKKTKKGKKSVTNRKDKKEKMESKFKENIPKARSKSKEPRGGKKFKKKSPMIPISNIRFLKKKDNYDYDQLSFFLIKFNGIMSQSLTKSNLWSKEIFYEPVYTTILEMFVEFLPIVNKKREVLIEEPGFIKGIFEIFYRLISNSGLVHFDQIQEWIGVPEVLPLNFKPRSKYWVKFMKNEKKKNEISKEIRDDLVVNEEISQQLKRLLIGISDFLRIKLSTYVELTDKIRKSSDVINGKEGKSLKSRSLNKNMKSLSDVLHIRKKMNEILILSFLICDELGGDEEEESDFYQREVNRVFDEVQNWKDCVMIAEEVRGWYRGLIGMRRKIGVEG